MTVIEDNLARLARARHAAGALLRSQRQGDTIDVIPLIPQAGAAIEPVTLDGAIDADHAEHALWIGAQLDLRFDILRSLLAQ